MYKNHTLPHPQDMINRYTFHHTFLTLTTVSIFASIVSVLSNNRVISTPVKNRYLSAHANHSNLLTVYSMVHSV